MYWTVDTSGQTNEDEKWEWTEERIFLWFGTPPKGCFCYFDYIALIGSSAERETLIPPIDSRIEYIGHDQTIHFVAIVWLVRLRIRCIQVLKKFKYYYDRSRSISTIMLALP